MSSILSSLVELGRRLQMEEKEIAGGREGWLSNSLYLHSPEARVNHTKSSLRVLTSQGEGKG